MSNEKMNFKNKEERKSFEEEMTKWKNRRKDWTWWQTFVWVVELFGVNFSIIVLIYSNNQSIFLAIL